MRGEGQSLESLWRYPTHEWYIPPVRPFLTNLQAVKLCLWPVRMLHHPTVYKGYKGIIFTHDIQLRRWLVGTIILSGLHVINAMV